MGAFASTGFVAAVFFFAALGAYAGAKELVGSLREERKRFARGVEYDLLLQRISKQALACSPDYEPSDLADAVDWLIEEHNSQRAFSEELSDDLQDRSHVLEQCEQDRRALTKERDEAKAATEKAIKYLADLEKSLSVAESERDQARCRYSDLETRIKNAKLKLDSPTDVVDLPTLWTDDEIVKPVVAYGSVTAGEPGPRVVEQWTASESPRPTLLPIIREAD